MRLAVVGTGYVGLVAGCGFAEMGNDVHCVDIVEAKVAALKRGEMPIYEPGLEALLERGLAEERLRFTTDLEGAVKHAAVIFIAVGTPPDEDGTADLSHVLTVARSVGRAMDGYRIIVVKSTVPVGTCDRVAKAVAEETDHPVDVVSNPEFLKEGAAVEDFMYPDRIVVGTASAQAKEVMEELYAPFVRTGHPVIHTDIRSSEMIKYAANAMLATRISFMNEISNLCERVGADVTAVRKGVGSDPRIGPRFLFPGVGYGGSCFPKDVKALIATARDHDFEMALLQAVESVNDAQKGVLVEKLLAHFDGDLKGRTIALWGLSFKPKRDDMREAPALVIIERLLALGAHVRAFDPVAAEVAATMLPPEVVLTRSNYDALDGADALTLVTEWNEFRNPDFNKIRDRLNQPVVVDGRNIWDPKRMRRLGFTYYAMGRP